MGLLKKARRTTPSHSTRKPPTTEMTLTLTCNTNYHQPHTHWASCIFDHALLQKRSDRFLNTESLDGDKERETAFWLGVGYLGNANYKTLLEAQTKIGISNTKNTDANDETNSQQWNYLKSHSFVDARLFLNRSFSVNFGLGLQLERKVGEKLGAKKVDLSNVTQTVRNFGTRFGFTYYQR